MLRERPMDVGQAGPKVTLVPVQHPLGVGASVLTQAQRVSLVILPFLVVGRRVWPELRTTGSAERPAVPHSPLIALGWARTPKLLSQPTQAAARAP